MMESIPALARDVIQLFDDRLEGRRFGELDRDALMTLAKTTEARALEVTEARVALEAAQAELERARGELSRRASQALSYARIHGADDPAVAEAVAQIDTIHATKKPPTRRRKRAVKKPPGEPDATELPFEEKRGAA
ncbi:MAG: hypothetical protein AB8I08_30675 [Sandaracinaceae bacterium]